MLSFISNEYCDLALKKELIGHTSVRVRTSASVWCSFMGKLTVIASQTPKITCIQVVRHNTKQNKAKINKTTLNWNVTKQKDGKIDKKEKGGMKTKTKITLYSLTNKALAQAEKSKQNIPLHRR